jgi:DNA-binding GntR family transcriptional regulator
MSRLRPVSMTDALVASLRERILDGQFAPEAALGEIELATAYGVARPTVRSAIQQLVHEGLLRRERSRSAHVPRLTHDDVRDLFLVRTPLELAVVETLVARGVHPDGAEHATRRMEALSPGASWSELVDTDLAFHRSLVEATVSPRLDRLYASLLAEIRLSLAQLRPAYPEPAALAAEHRELVDAIAGGDPERAPALMREHLDRAVADLTSAPADERAPAA